jgi:hypothetical protein
MDEGDISFLQNIYFYAFCVDRVWMRAYCFLRVAKALKVQGGPELDSRDTANYIRVDPHALMSVCEFSSKRCHAGTQDGFVCFSVRNF